MTDYDIRRIPSFDIGRVSQTPFMGPISDVQGKLVADDEPISSCVPLRAG